MCKLKCSNLKLPIETGRWANILKQNWKCHLCNLEIGNEFRSYGARIMPKHIKCAKTLEPLI
jgi:transposase-like protein